jgi:hypothetical protein
LTAFELSPQLVVEKIFLLTKKLGLMNENKLLKRQEGINTRHRMPPSNLSLRLKSNNQQI